MIGTDTFPIPHGKEKQCASSLYQLIALIDGERKVGIKAWEKVAVYSSQPGVKIVITAEMT